MKNELGVNPWRIFREIHETGRGMAHFYYGFDAALYSRLGYLFIRNFLYIFTHYIDIKQYMIKLNQLNHSMI